ncbi:MAG: sugar phosphate isomerase/epimerase [Clostridia bacterium]|nr:sugar phosphate isomerase/epimerase [Clostridia bacterium]
MKLACTSLMVPGKTLVEKAEKLKKWGYDGISVFEEYSQWNELKMDELMQLEFKTGVRPCEFVFMDDVYGHLMDQNTEIKAKAIKMYSDAIEVCKKIGAITEMEFDLGPQDPLPLFEPYKKMSKEEEKGFLAVLNELGSIAEGSSALILLEPVNRYETKYLTTLQDCLEMIKKTDLSNVGLLPDFFHLSIEESNIQKALRNAGPYIKHVHLGDNNRLLPGKGTIDWTASMNVLKEVEFNGFMNLECAVLGNPNEELPKAAEFLKSLL